jgi:hypothetical protein
LEFETWNLELKKLKINSTTMSSVRLREFNPTDTHAISRLHAQSWSTAYRGILLDSYLDHEVESERTNYWKAKIPQLTAKEFIIIAEQDGDIVGFAAVMDKPEKGYDAMLDNLHVRPDLKGKHGLSQDTGTVEFGGKTVGRTRFVWTDLNTLIRD